MKKLILFVVFTLTFYFTSYSQCSMTANVSDPPCVNDLGTISVNFMNAAAPFELNINGQSITTSDNPYVAQYPSGLYEIELTDANNCMSAITAVVNEALPIFLDIGPPSAFCTGSSVCIFATVTGGTGGYSYQWSDGQNQQTICTDFAGTYSLTVTDANGCSTVESIELLQFPSPVVDITEEIVDCNNSALTANVTGNPVSLSYIWNNNQITQSIHVTQPATYSVTVVDVNGCVGFDDFVYNGGQLFYQASVLNISCFGSADGEIQGFLPSGATPTTIQWTGPNGYASNQLNINNLEAGQYTLQLSDGMGCDGTFNYTISEPNSMELTSTTNDPVCNGSCDGEIAIAVTGGTAPYTYDWSPTNSTTSVLTGVCAGTYEVTVTDSNGCQESISITLGEPPAIVSGLTFSNQSCLADGMAAVSPSGGFGSFSIDWSNGETGNSINDLIAGNYSVTVVDENGCFLAEDFEISSPIGLEVSSTYTGCNMSDGTATAVVTGGASSPSFEWSNGQTTATATGLIAGGYSVTITDNATQCQTHQNIIVEEDSTCFVLISGYVFVDDIIQDCVIDADTEPTAYVRVELSDGQVQYTDVNGFYQFSADAGAYQILITPSSSYETLCSDPIDVDALEWGENYTDNNFYLKYGPDTDVRLKVVKFNARPGFTQRVRICLMNVGGVPASGTLSFTHPDILEYLFSSPMETNYVDSTHTVTWEYTDLPPSTTWIYYPELLVPVDTDLGTEITYSFTAGDLNNDINPIDNEITCSIEVTGSFDPNDKAVDPMGVGENGAISMSDSLLSYKIRFQNTGTDTAFTVLIRDTLDVDLDTRTIIPGPSSHDYSMSIVDGNIVELLFENILLPDSFVNEPGSNGFVIFDIEVKSGAPYGTRIENTAGIFFDFNPPVITNTVVNTIQMILNIDDPKLSEMDLTVSPNPTTGQSYLIYDLEKAEKVTIALYDLQGKFIKLITNGVNQPKGVQRILLETSNFSNGMYFVNIRTESGKQGIVKLIQAK